MKDIAIAIANDPNASGIVKGDCSAIMSELASYFVAPRIFSCLIHLLENFAIKQRRYLDYETPLQKQSPRQGRFLETPSCNPLMVA